MSNTAKLLIWALSAALAMFAVFAWLPEWTGPIGILIGFLSVLMVEKLVSSKSFMKDMFLFIVFAVFVIFSYVVLWSTCKYLPGISQCREIDKELFLLSSILYPAVPIIPLYIFVWVPRHFRNWLRK